MRQELGAVRGCSTHLGGKGKCDSGGRNKAYSVFYTAESSESTEVGFWGGAKCKYCARSCRNANNDFKTVMSSLASVCAKEEAAE